ncbi:hypothetical protein ASPVEDRAFT_740275 [Aspergillus versicolor CBS 583.65]|uniref:Uncharacterized protein n=1 Tax=Aspergillus versicolor CBS 583.65 TaxID=1036611 RepID=A0A1L9PPZ7_ASPVE|nr:uncharacterized protein ASPVEDRAFT_740275 [Aspergillus versicolor CBS 583.65]OJJ03581.1 hypothetical protein ASPVEDRAFT_740275 [Aspergillus versicolor CBS 583.65]
MVIPWNAPSIPFPLWVVDGLDLLTRKVVCLNDLTPEGQRTLYNWGNRRSDHADFAHSTHQQECRFDVSLLRVDEFPATTRKGAFLAVGDAREQWASQHRVRHGQHQIGSGVEDDDSRANWPASRVAAVHHLGAI